MDACLGVLLVVEDWVEHAVAPEVAAAPGDDGTRQPEAIQPGPWVPVHQHPHWVEDVEGSTTLATDRTFGAVLNVLERDLLEVGDHRLPTVQVRYLHLVTMAGDHQLGLRTVFPL